MTDESSALERVRHEWLRRVEAEYRSATLTSHFALWLLQLTAPFELVRLALSIVDDELAHSELSYAVYAAAGGRAQLHLPRDGLGLQAPSHVPLEHSMLRAGLEAFCIGETVAVRLFSRMREGVQQSDAKAALDRIVKDEVKHREFGWTWLEWLFSRSDAEPLKELTRRELGEMFSRLRKNYSFDSLGKAADDDPVARRYGLIPAPVYASALVETLERDYVPRFAEHGIDAKSAWDSGL